VSEADEQPSVHTAILKTATTMIAHMHAHTHAHMHTHRHLFTGTMPLRNTVVMYNAYTCNP